MNSVTLVYIAKLAWNYKALTLKKIFVSYRDLEKKSIYISCE